MKNNSGQVIVLILLLALLGVSVSLSALSRTLQDLRQTTEIDESSRALAAAEAGVEIGIQRILSDNCPSYPCVGVESDLGNLAGYNYTINQASQGPVEPDEPLPQDEVYQINLDGFSDGSRQVSLFWGLGETQVGQGSGKYPALLLTFVTQDGSDYGLQKYAFDPNVSRGNNFSGADTGSYGCRGCTVNDYKFRVQNITVPNHTKILRIKALYNQASFALEPPVGFPFPRQGYTIRSEGQTVGGVKRVVEVSQSYSALPPIFDFALFAKGDISKE